MAYIYLRKDSHPFRKTGLISFYFMSVNSLPYKKLLLSGKTQKDKIILLEALYNRTSGVHFQKASPP